MNKDIILLRGLFRQKGHWGDFATELQRLLPNSRVLCLDIAGAGERANEDSPNSIDAMVESLRSQLKLKRPISLIAMSMGGMIGIKWMELYPDEIDKLICINTSSKNSSPFYQRLRPKNYIKMLYALFASAYQREKLIFSLLSNAALNQEIIQNWVKLSQKNPTRKSNFFRQLIAAIDFEAKKPKSTIYFLSSVRDQLVSHHATRALADAWNMPLIINYRDGHDIALDNPAWLNEILLELLADNPLRCS